SPLAARLAPSTEASNTYSSCRRSGTASVSCCAVQCGREGKWGKVCMALSRDADAVRVGELVGARDDDALAFPQSRHDFHGVEAAGPGLDRAAGGTAALDHPGDAAAVLFQERATLDHQHVLARVQHDARGQALVLAQVRRLLVLLEAQPRGDLAVDH